MGDLLGYLEGEFEQRREECTMIIEPSLPYSVDGSQVTRKPDGLIFKDGIFVIVDLKGFGGEFTADCSWGGRWLDSNGNDLLELGRKNPFSQARDARVALMKLIVRNYVRLENAPDWAKKKDGALNNWVGRSIKSWVICLEGSIPRVIGSDRSGKVIDSATYPFFKVLPLERLAGNLAFVRGERPVLPASDMARFIEGLQAQPTTRGEWMRGALILTDRQHLGLVPRITDWMDSGDGNLVSKALDRIRELDLKSHLVHVVRCWDDVKVGSLRQRALITLIEWQYDGLGVVLKDALVDHDRDIVAFALQFLTQNSYPETVPSLIEKLTQGQASDRPTILKALAFSGSPLAGPAILSFVQKEFAGQPFKEFLRWAEKAHHVHSRNRGDRSEEWEAFDRQEAKRHEIIKTFKASVAALGELDYKPASPWLLRIVEHPTSIGFDSDEFKKLDIRDSDYYSIFGCVCDALGTVGRGNSAVLGVLLARLSDSPDDYRDLIIPVLGDLGDQAAVHQLLPYVGGKSKYRSNAAIDALSKLRSSEAFEPIAMSYFSDPHDDSARWTADALANIDPARFEVDLIKWISDPRVNDEDREEYLQVLWPLATDVSADTLFKLLPSPKFAGIVPWILGRLCHDGPNLKLALELTFSKDPVEAGAAIQTLTDYFVAKLPELELYQTNSPPVEVRRAVTDVYFVAKSRANLMKFANDLDEHVRDTVFLAFKGSFYEDRCQVIGLHDSAQACEMGLDKDGEYLAIQLANEVHFVATNSILLSFRSSHGKFQRLYLKYRAADGVFHDLLISVQSVSFAETRDHLVNLLPTLKLGDGVQQDKLAPDDLERVEELWEKIVVPTAQS